MGIGEAIIGGTLRGVLEDPITGFFAKRIIDAFPDATEDQISGLVERSRSSGVGDVFAIAGEFAPMFALGSGALSLGRKVAVGAVKHLGKKEILRLGAARALESQTGRTAARQIALTERAEQLGAAFGPKGAQSGILEAMPKLERGAEIVGGALGIGGLVGVEETMDGAPVEDAIRTAMIAATLTAGFEGFLTIGGKVVRRARDANRDKTNAAGAKHVIKTMDKAQKKATKKQTKANIALNETIGLHSQETELLYGRVATNHITNLREAVTVHKASQKSGEFIEKKLAGVIDDADLTKLMETTRKSIAKRNRSISKARQSIRKEQGLYTAAEKFKKSPLAGYTQGEPFNPAAMREFIEVMKLKVAITPEAFKGRGSRVMNKFFEDWEHAYAESSIARAQNEAFIDNMHSRMTKALGAKRGISKDKRVARSGASFMPLFNEWEKFGEQGVRNFMSSKGRGQFADEVVGLFNQLEERFMAGFRHLNQIGGADIISKEELRKFGLAKFFPHIISKRDMSITLRKLTETRGSVYAQKWMARQKREGLSKFGSIDENRMKAGSMMEKIAAGDPLEADPFLAAFRYLDEVGMRLSYGKRFGIDGQLKNAIQDAAVKEGFSKPIANTLIDAALNHDYYDQAMRRASKILTDFQTGSKLTLAVIPNATQTFNNLLFSGARNFVNGMIRRTKGELRSDVVQAVALGESVMTGAIGRDIGEGVLRGTDASRAANLLGNFAHYSLKLSGFTSVERWNRVSAGFIGYHTVFDSIAKASRGKIRGRTLDLARRRMETLGVDLDDMVLKVQRNGDDYFKTDEFQDVMRFAMWRSSTITQFNPNPLRRPILWNHPVGRVFAQFKTFALGQGRFLRDQVLAEAVRGNYKPASYFLGLYPIAGEAVGDVRALLKGKDRGEMSAPDRYISDITMVGGAGIFSDLYTSARFGRSAESILGPTFGEGFQTIENIAQGNPGKVLDQFGRMPVWQATKAVMAGGIITAALIDQYIDAVSDSESDGRTVIDVGLLRTSK